MINQYTTIIITFFTLICACSSNQLNEIQSSFVYSIKEHGDSIFYSTNKGEIFRFHLEYPKSTVKVGEKKYHPIRSLLFADDGSLMACSYRSGLYRVCKDTFLTKHSWLHPSWSMKTDPDGKIWLASKNGVYRQNGDTFELMTDLREAFDLDFFNGELVAAHYRGLSFFDMKKGIVRKTICKDTICWMSTVIGSNLICGGVECCVIIENDHRRTVKLGPEGNIPWACAMDSMGAVILATEKGLYKVNRNSKDAYCIGYAEKCIKSVLIDSKGRLWVGKYF